MARQYQFDDFTLDHSRYRLQRGERLLRLEKLPMELLILLVQRGGELVSREEIAERLWGKDVFVDIDHSINTAVRKIRQVLKDNPEKPRFLETVVGKGYRFAAPVICRNGASVSQPEVPVAPVRVGEDAAVPSTESQHRWAPRWTVIGTVGVLASLIVAGVWFRGRTVKSAAHPAIKSIAVLPLKNLSGDPSQDYLADGMTEELIGRLSRIHDLRVISRTSVMHYKDTQLSMPEIARTLRVDALVEGSVIKEGNRIRVHAQLIRGATDEHFWSETYDRELRDVLALESDVAQSIAGKVEVTVTGEERARLVAARPVSPEVYEIYVKAINSPSYTKVGVEQNIAQFEEAIHKDPTFAPAYVGLAGEYEYLGTIFIGGNPAETRPKVISAAQKAIELDPNLAAPHILLADIYQRQWQWREAEAEYKLALELGPNDAEALRGFADWLMCQARIDEALAWARRARELDPLGAGGARIAWILIMGHRYDEAIREVKTTLSVYPNAAYPQFVLAFALIFNGQADEAISVLEKTASRTNRGPGPLEMLAPAYARAGRRTEAYRIIEEMKERRRKGYFPAGAFINSYLALGDYDQAFYWCDEAYKEQSNILQYLKVQPFFDPVRGDPRFIDLQRRVGLN
jgi:TolB-like protein/DNA-binding winged helix-turn-helix (wHTH) protein/tetratricopeptide (TPR) repeat protein